MKRSIPIHPERKSDAIEPENGAVPEGAIRVRVVGVGVCDNTDVPKHEGSVLPPHALLGHEVSGIVDEIGPKVNSVDIGDHVVVISDSCPTCVRCTAGDPAYSVETPVTPGSSPRAWCTTVVA
ncbi:alcohol dehydrogenase catalytic domain-containing protein [Rhodococcus opacus]|uniref:alcohol dehydrogenase catalytic domain-containing protein n=1 Tax=Rhodococcus opacus TaxID=37919 RepID=UPI0009BE0CC4|nr:alcohol dehydrogenase catalytic domain-containing protein [Rhodococcus opacus]